MSATEHQSWRQLPFTAQAIDRELASVEALLAGLGNSDQPTVRWYGAPSLGLVIGTGQRVGEIDLAACAAAGIAVHRRRSGGTAVLFEPGFLMQDIALPRSHPLHVADVTESYRWLGAAWQATLGRFGIAAEPVPVAAARADTQALDPLVRRACFGGQSPYEVLVGGRKVVGFSQVRRRDGLVLQVGVYWHWSPQTLASLLVIAPDEQHALATRLHERVAGLEDLLPTPPTHKAVMSTFTDVLTTQQHAQIEPGDWSAAELAALDDALPRYAAIEPAPPAA